LPREELIAELKTLTNLRAVRDEDSPTGWKMEVGPFPGWETVPSWRSWRILIVAQPSEKIDLPVGQLVRLRTHEMDRKISYRPKENVPTPPISRKP